MMMTMVVVLKGAWILNDVLSAHSRKESFVWRKEDSHQGKGRMGL
jgi:hypothetical protein